jgi:hypothetical protein
VEAVMFENHVWSLEEIVGLMVRFQMILSSGELDTLRLRVAKELFGTNVFRGRRLMLVVEARVKEMNAWTEEDDVLSASAGTKSKGLANIDWSITRLEGRGLKKLWWDQWEVSN